MTEFRVGDKVRSAIGTVTGLAGPGLVYVETRVADRYYGCTVYAESDLELVERPDPKIGTRWRHAIHPGKKTFGSEFIYLGNGRYIRLDDEEIFDARVPHSIDVSDFIEVK